MNRVKLGIFGLDEMIQGGVPEGSVIAVLGAFGTGKTTFAMQFINYGLVNGENCVYISLEEDEESLIKTAEAFHWDFRKYLDEGKLKVMVLEPEDLENLTKSLESELPYFLKEFSTKRVAVDSVSLLTMLMKSDVEKRKALLSLTRGIKECGATAILTAEVDKDNPTVSREGLVEYVADGVVLLSYYKRGGDVKLTVEIVKMRRTPHMRKIKPYLITNRGIQVLTQAEIY